MIPILCGMIATACFFVAAFKHEQRGEHIYANRCVVMTVISLALLIIAVAIEL